MCQALMTNGLFASHNGFWQNLWDPAGLVAPKKKQTDPAPQAAPTAAQVMYPAGLTTADNQQAAADDQKKKSLQMVAAMQTPQSGAEIK